MATCRDKYHEMFPERKGNSPVRDGKCPSWYDLLDDPAWCTNGTKDSECTRCWDREMPREYFSDPFTLKEKTMGRNATAQCERCIHGNVCKLRCTLADASIRVNELLTEIEAPFIYPVELKCREYYVVTESSVQSYDYNQRSTATVSNSEHIKAVYTLEG